jgi:hypothetical protein
MTHSFGKGDIVRISPRCTDVWVSKYVLGMLCIVTDAVLSEHPGQEGRVRILPVYEDGSGTGGTVCLPEFLVPAEDAVALATKAAYERRMVAQAAEEETLARARASIAGEYGLDPEVADRFYQARRAWEYDHGDDS